MLYKFGQNNSGGHTVEDDTICEVMIIEAETEEQVIEKAEDLGIYFDGCDSGADCECCGDRWSRWADEIAFPYEWSGETIYKNIEEYIDHNILGNNNVNFFWKRSTRIFYTDGTIKEYNIKENK